MIEIVFGDFVTSGSYTAGAIRAEIPSMSESVLLSVYQVPDSVRKAIYSGQKVFQADVFYEEDDYGDEYLAFYNWIV